jgi:2-polyprenyl-3-methyl-5-hydroxy-6-metoxy-1,4-benzoquinol methylase
MKFKNEIAGIWDTRYTSDFIEAKSLSEYKNHMGIIVRDLIDLLDSIAGKLDIHYLRILDIGGGYGALLKLLFDGSNEKYLIDLAPSAIRFAKEKYGIENVFVADILSELPPEISEQRYDVVLLTEVLEHIRPELTDALIDRTFGLMNSGGYLLLSTPNLASMTSRINLLKGNEPVVFTLDTGHINAFTAKKLARALNVFADVKIYSTPLRYRQHHIPFFKQALLGEHLVAVCRK